MCVYFWALYFVPLIYVSVFMLIPYCFDYHSFVIEFEVREYDASSFVLQDCFGYLGFLCFYTNFRSICYFFERWHWNFDRGCIQSINCFGWCEHLNSIDSSKPRSICIFELKKSYQKLYIENYRISMPEVIFVDHPLQLPHRK